MAHGSSKVASSSTTNGRPSGAVAGALGVAEAEGDAVGAEADAAGAGVDATGDVTGAEQPASVISATVRVSARPMN